MVDVWKELGKAIGAIFKPLYEIPAALWKAAGDAAGDLIEGFMGAASGLKTTLEPTITDLMPGVFDEAAAALSEGSPPEEIKDAVDKFIKQLMEMIEKEAKTEGHSLPTGTELTITQGKLVSGIIGMYAATHAISIALDATQPLKDWGFKTAIMDMLYQFKMSDVIGPMIQAPIWASVVTPLRMRARASNPYEVPGTGVLPYLRAKNLIDDTDYKQNMAYNALDSSWSDHMLENTWRYPDFSDTRNMIHRGVMTWTDARAALEKTLVKSEYLDAYEALIPSIPSVSDLVRFAVREAYPDATGFEEHYARMSEWMARQGYTQYFADSFWTAHWIIPTISQADELYHRGEITEEEHTALYILNDIRPEDIPNLRKLTWKRPGRIESRWMFRWGEIDATDLRDFLIDDGLDPEYADSVAAAMAKNQFLSDINREVANIKADYAKGYIVESTLRSDLAALGFRPEIVEYHMIDAVADRERSIRDDQLSTLRSQYARGAITMDEVLAEAEKIIMDKDIRDAWVAALPAAKEEKIVEETYTTEVNRLVSNVKADYTKGYIEKTDLVSRLTLLGLPAEVIDYHVMDADEDRTRKRNDERLTVIKDMWMKDVETDFDVIEGWVKEVIVDEEARDLWLNDAYFDKFKTVTR